MPPRSVAISRAREYQDGGRGRRDDRTGFIRNFAVTLTLGIVFLIGQAYDYATLGFGIADGPFGTGRGLRSGQRVLWYWCELSAAERCPPTLEIGLDADRVAPGGAVQATVRAYDDDGHGAPVAGATATLGDATATSGADGAATLVAPTAPGAYDVTGTAPGDVSGFPARLEVG